MRDLSRYAQLIALALGSALLVFLWARQITGAPIEKDAAQMVRMALNLERHGVISLDEAPPLSPTNYREPLPALITALGIRIIDAVQGEAPPEAYFSGRRVQLLKYQNVLWLALLSLGAFFAARGLTASRALALLCVLLVNCAVLRGEAELIDNLYTDIQAAALLMLASAALAAAVARRRPGWWLLAGALFGALTLVKAAVLYIFAGTVVVLACVYLMRRVPLAMAGRDLVLFAAAFGCAVAPWMYRNHVQLGSAHISQRAGVVLMYRAVYDQMTPTEYRGTFYVWAPQRLQAVLGRVLGFSPADLERNGRLQRLNDDGDSQFAAEDLAAERAGAPERTLSYYRQARAEREKLETELASLGPAQSEIEADDRLKAKATKIVLEHPWRELGLTVSFLWRGATLAFPFLVFALCIAWRRRRDDLLLFAVPAFGTVMLYALATHFIARYDFPSLEVALVAIVASLNALARAPAASRASGAL
jgi:hypothetical protein